MVLVSPSLFNVNREDLATRVKQVPNADYLHLDVTDGVFVKDAAGGTSLFWNESELEAVVSNSTVPLDIHLMVADPIKHVRRYLSYHPCYLSFHLEATANPQAVINEIRRGGAQPALALNPDTSLDGLAPFLNDLPLVLLMSVVPGKGGQGYISEVTEKIRALKRMITIRGLATLIEVDGGIKLGNARIPAAAGADILVSGTGVFNHPEYDPVKVIELIKSY